MTVIPSKQRHQAIKIAMRWLLVRCFNRADESRRFWLLL